MIIGIEIGDGISHIRCYETGNLLCYVLRYIQVWQQKLPGGQLCQK